MCNVRERERVGGRERERVCVCVSFAIPLDLLTEIRCRRKANEFITVAACDWWTNLTRARQFRVSGVRCGCEYCPVCVVGVNNVRCALWV